MKLTFVLGTRPEIIKLAPLIKKTTSRNSTIVFTSQHYDFDMSLRFIKELGIRKPDHTMKLTKIQNTTSDRATQTGEIIIKLAKIISSLDTDTIIVQGDTNTVLAAAITSIKCGIPISHVEAGLRSYDWRMPEEHNRIAVDHISELLFAPTVKNKKILEKENVHGDIFVTGNTSIDAVEENIYLSEKKSTIKVDGDDGRRKRPAHEVAARQGISSAGWGVTSHPIHRTSLADLGKNPVPFETDSALGEIAVLFHTPGSFLILATYRIP